MAPTHSAAAAAQALDCGFFPRGGVQNFLYARFDYAGWVGGSQIGPESGRASRCTRAGGWVGGTLSFCTVPVWDCQ